MSAYTIGYKVKNPHAAKFGDTVHQLTFRERNPNASIIERRAEYEAGKKHGLALNSVNIIWITDADGAHVLA